jgi:beta-N-acetylhexosaminidase
VKGQQDGGVISAIKYFPGTGSSKIDPKKELVKIDLDKSLLNSRDLVPFKENLQVADSIITSLAIYSKFDELNQAAFSSIIINNILKEEYGYLGLIITDDLNSPSVNVEEKFSKAFIAGHDLLFSSANYSEMIEAKKEIESKVNSNQIPIERLNESVFKILKYKFKYSLIK